MHSLSLSLWLWEKEGVCVWGGGGGTFFEGNLKWNLNTESITKEGHQWLHLLWKLSSFNTDPTILKLFDNSFAQSILTFSFICWFYNFNTKQINSVQRILAPK